MNFQIGQIISAMVQVTYPGGLQAFVEGGGKFSLVPKAPSTDPELLIYFPTELPTEFRDKIKGTAGHIGLPVRFTTLRNFKDVDPETIDSHYAEALKNVVESYGSDGALMLAVSELATFVTCQNPIEHDKAEALASDIHKAVPEITRVYVICETYSYCSEQATPTPVSQIVMLSDMPPRKTVINDDDLLNLRIALETATSIDDLINSI